MSRCSTAAIAGWPSRARRSSACSTIPKPRPARWIRTTCSSVSRTPRRSGLELDRLRAERRAPMRQALLQHAVAAEDELFVAQRFELFEAEALRSVRVPRRLERAGPLRALAQSEGQAVPDRREVRRAAGPLL